MARHTATEDADASGCASKLVYNVTDFRMKEIEPMKRRVKTPTLLAAALFAALLAATAFSAAVVTTRAVERNGKPAAEVLVGNASVVELVTSVGIYSPMQRAELVASRLQAALKTNPKPADVRVAAVRGGRALYLGKTVLVTAGNREALAQKSTPRALTTSWRKKLVQALETEQAVAATAVADQPTSAPAAPAAAAPPADAPAPRAPGEIDWTGTSQKWVPIISLEQAGLSIGAAQVAGPTEQVKKVKAVAQLRLDFKEMARIYAYIPASSINVTKLDRVQGVSVWATGDIQLINF
jgi:hypothetical protein